MIRCGGKCGDPACAKEFPDLDRLNGHVGGRKARHAKKGGEPAAATVPATGERVYPPLLEWKGSQPSPAAGGTPTAPGGPAPAGPAAVFDSSPLWLGVGRAIDETLLRDKPYKIGMTEARARALDASLQQMGFLIEKPAAPVTVPYWLPFLITFAGAFGMPLLVGVLPAVLDRLKDFAGSLKRRGKGDSEGPGAGARTKGGDSTLPPAAPVEPRGPSPLARGGGKYGLWWGR